MKALILALLAASLVTNGVLSYLLFRSAAQAPIAAKAKETQAAAEAARLKDEIATINRQLRSMGENYYSLSRESWQLPSSRESERPKLDQEMDQISRKAFDLAATNQMIFKAYRVAAAQAGASWTEGPPSPMEVSLPLYMK